MFIIRTVFWLSVVVLLLPIGGEDPETQAGEPRLSAGDAINAAISTVGDVAGLCTRKPEVCEAGSAAWTTLQVKATHGAKLLYRWAQGDDAQVEDMGPQQVVPVQENAGVTGGTQTVPSFRLGERVVPLHTGSAGQRTIASNTSSDRSRSQNTLGIEDLIPEWKGPARKARA